MKFIDLIEKKKLGQAHSKNEIDFVVNSYLTGMASEAQVAAWLIAVSFKGLNVDETAWLAEALGNSGKVIDFSEFSAKVVDKHSTGGVGDKVTITLIPLLAAAGVPVAKLADRALGHVAGTVDKLESIPNFNTSLSTSEIVEQLKAVNGVISSQIDDLAPVDKKMYSLRNSISAMDSEELIAASIISKKIASGASHVIIDVKYGSGAFMKLADDALRLSRLIVNIGKILGKSITVVTTSMEEPLGRAIGNSLEVIESIEFLRGNLEGTDLADITYSIAAMTLVQLNMYATVDEAVEFLKNLIQSGKAIDKVKEIIVAQGGDVEVVNNYDRFALPMYKVQCDSKKSGFIQSINAFNISKAIEALGGARIDDNKPIDLSVGIYLNKKNGEFVEKGETLYTIYSNDEKATKEAQNLCDEAFSINESKPAHKKLIYEIISTNDEDDNV